MFDLISPFFDQLYAEYGINMATFRDSYDFGRYVNGIATSLKLIALVLALSIIIGLLGAAAQKSRFAPVRWLMTVYIELFRNTPPIVQLLFFYFGLGAFTPTMDMGGWQEPILSGFGWSVIALSIFGGSYNVEIFRSGIDAVPGSLSETAEALGLKQHQAFRLVVLPLAVRICFPALTNNLISLAKTTSLAYVVAVPEVTYTLSQVWTDNANVPEMMLLLFLTYFVLITLIAFALHRVEIRIRIPGAGR